MRTEFSRQNYDDSQRAHLAAREQFYPLLFPDCDLEFTDTTKTALDMEYAIDCKIAVSNPALDLRAPLWLAVQERWRFDLGWISAGDVTVTEWNLASSTPSELHKLGAHLLVYGFYDKRRDEIACATVVDVARLLLDTVRGQLSYTRWPRCDQTFLAFGIDALSERNAIIMTRMLTPVAEMLREA